MNTMDKSLTNIDLNLLRTLHVLLEERSVTNAANRLFVTQSAVSKSLQRLRELLDDPLFVRSLHGLLPTPRATELAAPLQQMFEQVESWLMPVRFDPAAVQGRVRIATPESLALATIPQLVTRLCDVAPNLSLESQHLMADHMEQLAAGGLDFVINIDQPTPDGYSAWNICSTSLMFWHRSGHPLAKKKSIKLADVCAYPQITFHAPNLTPNIFRAIERIFVEAGLRRKVILDTTHLLIALDVMVKTDALMLAPDYLSRLSILQDEIVSRPVSHIPAFDRLQLNLSLVQHNRTLESPMHRWVASEISNIFSTATG